METTKCFTPHVKCFTPHVCDGFSLYAFLEIMHKAIRIEIDKKFLESINQK